MGKTENRNRGWQEISCLYQVFGSGTFNKRKLHMRPHGGRAKSKINISVNIPSIYIEMVISGEWASLVLALLVQIMDK